MSQNKLNHQLILPCGAVLKNRIAKSAMSEALGNSRHEADENLQKLYHRWALGGTGLLITGNVMVDATALGEPGNVAFTKNRGIEDLKKWAEASVIENTHVWVQLNHPGKQSPKFLSKEPVSPSAIAFGPPLGNMFYPPRALTEKEIFDIIEAFAFASKSVKDAGFTGVQIHGAHGYLVSQFLSPLHNQRQDQWGGSLANRMRFVMNLYQAIRQSVGPAFPVGIKLNSADFQRGGFTQEESMDVVQALSERGMDLIEISGGTYEAPAMTGAAPGKQKKSTQEREAYFLGYCEEVRKRVKTPLMLTGGFRSREGMEEALQSGACDVIGLARPLAINPDFSKALLRGENITSPVKPLSTGIRALDKLVPLEVTWYTHQLQRMGKGQEPDPDLGEIKSILSTFITMGIQNLRRTRTR